MQRVAIHDHRENSEKNHTKIIVWDSEDVYPTGDWITVLWADFPKSDEPNVHSIPLIAEEKADTYKSRYLNWIYVLGETIIKGTRVVDHLELRSGFSYWWMTSLAQKFNASGTSSVDDIIKLLVLEDFIRESGINSISLKSDNTSLNIILENFCKQNKFKYNFDYINKTNKVKRNQPKFVRLAKALIFYFLYLKNFLVFSGRSKVRKHSLNPDAELCFIDVLVHLNKESLNSNKFISNYWTYLVDYLSHEGIKSNWIHNYFKHSDITSIKQAEHLLMRFNKSGEQTHFLIESNLNARVVFRAFKDYLRLNRKNHKLTSICKSFIIPGYTMNIWPFLENEWKETLCGSDAIMNCLRISLFEYTFSLIPHQKMGVYIQENQQWEMALVHMWKKNGHGKLIGVPHATVRYWDLRYFYDPRTYNQNKINGLPMPDFVAVNGIVARNHFIHGGYPESKIVEVEALRYFHLLEQEKFAVTHLHEKMGLRVLICGDFLGATNLKMMDWLLIATKSIHQEISFIFKPHPAYSFDLSDYSSLNIKISNSPLSSLFPEADVVFTSNITSASVDAYYAGKYIIQMLDGKTLNVSPLRGLDDVVYVTNPMELSTALLNTHEYKLKKHESYFFLDHDLIRWKKMIGNR